MKKVIISLISLLILFGCNAQISLEDAIEEVRDYADFNEGTMSIITTKDEDDGRYIVLEDNGYEVEAKVAYDGNIIMFNRLETNNTIPDSPSNTTNNGNSNSSNNTPSYLSNPNLIDDIEASLKTVLDSLSISEDDIYNLTIEDEYNNNRIIYSIDFNTVDYEYEFLVNPEDLSIINEESDRNDDRFISFDATVTRQRAIEIALETNNLNVDDICDFKIEETYYQGNSIYEIDYDSYGAEYELIIDANSEEVIRNDSYQKGNSHHYRD